MRVKKIALNCNKKSICGVFIISYIKNSLEAEKKRRLVILKDLIFLRQSHQAIFNFETEKKNRIV